MIQDIKNDCPLNSIIIIEFVDKKIEGNLIAIDSNKLKIKTIAGISVLMAKKLENIVGYEVLSSKNTNENLPEKNITKSELVSRKKVELTEENIKKDRSLQTLKEPLLQYKSLFEKIDNISFFLSKEDFNFELKKVDKYDTDQETFELYRQMQRVEAKYRYALKVSDKEDRFREISSILELLLSNNYFNNEIRYNLAFLRCNMGEYSNAINYLVELQEYKKDKDILLFLSFLQYKNNQHFETAQNLVKYFDGQVIDKDQGLFLIKIIAQTKTYFLLKELFNNLLDKSAPFSLEELFAITLFFGQRNSDVLKKIKTETEISIRESIINNVEIISKETPKEIIEKIELKELKKKSENILIANAEITQYWASSERGNLMYIDKRKRRFLASFKVADILEQDVRNKLKNGLLKRPIPIFCFIEDNPNRGAVKLAKAIQLPKSVKLQLASVNLLVKKKELDVARGILKEILLQFPEEIECQKLIQELPEPVKYIPSPKSNRPKRKGKTYKHYNEANLARQQQKWDEAKKLFIKAIELNENKESAIKDLASIYQREGEIKKAIDLVEKHMSEAQSKESYYNFLSHLYFANGQYKKTVEILKKVLSLNPTKKGDLRKRSIEIKKRMAFAYVKAEDYFNAKKLLNEILKKSTNDSVVKKWLVGLEEAEQTGQYGNIESLFSDTDFNILMTGLSPLMVNALENCDYAGLKATEIAEENFTQNTLNRLRKAINETLGNKPKERASYRLTEAKLMQILEPENEPRMKSVLSKYCNDIALSCASSNYPAPVIRSYYIEAFSLDMNWESLARQVSLFLSTFYLPGEQIILENQKGISFEKAINNIFELENNSDVIWNSILEMSIANPTITAKILWKIYGDKNSKKSAFEFLNKINIPIIKNSSENEFKLHWNKARENRKAEFDAWFDKIYALTNTENLNAFAAIIQINSKSITTEWLNEIDIARWQSMMNDVINSCLDYLKQDVFDEKERLYNNISASISRLLSEIQEKPTRFSYEGFSPLLKHIEGLIKNHFNQVLKNSTPNISLQVQGEVAAIKGKLDVQIAIINEDRHKAPIYDTKISIESTKGFKLSGEPILYYDTIRGGEQKMVKLTLDVSEEVIQQKIGDIELICKYKARNLNEYVEIKSGQTISLYDESEFKPIDNIFARYANSNAVKEESMFKGRSGFINDIVKTFLESESKCVVIYGQKRSGKSSVLYHLKKQLNETKKAFCLDFSLGAIITEWSVATFYNKILNELGKELRRLKRNGEVVPNFEKPAIEAIEKHPTSIFQETMEQFIDDCYDLESWREKKLTVLIDEFTYLYSSIQRKTIPKDFMKVWKNTIDQSYFNSVLIGQDVMPDFMAQFPNEFGVVDDHRLNYLAVKDAKELIESPIWNKEKDESRFLGKAIDKIIDYTAGNPYYIQIFCDRLVSFLNTACRAQVTELTVDDVAKSLTEGKDALLEKQFDNLLTAGDADLETNPPKYTFEVLKQIAKASKNFGYCSKESIFEHLSDSDIKDKLPNILKDLHLRQVISLKQGNYRIQVQLFQQWLLNR